MNGGMKKAFRIKQFQAHQNNNTIIIYQNKIYSFNKKNVYFFKGNLLSKEENLRSPN